MKVTFEMEGVDEFLKDMDGAFQLLVRARRELVTETAQNVSLMAKDTASVRSFTGTLAKRIGYRVSPSGAAATIKARAPHAWIIGRGGRRPGAKMPPLDKLEYWRLARGIKVSAFALARSIARKGIKPVRFLDEAWETYRQDFIDGMNRLTDRFIDAVGGRR